MSARWVDGLVIMDEEDAQEIVAALEAARTQLQVIAVNSRIELSYARSIDKTLAIVRAALARLRP